MLSPIANKTPNEAWRASVHILSAGDVNIESLSRVYAQILSVESYILSRFIDTFELFYSESERKFGVPAGNVGSCSHDLFDSILEGYELSFAGEENKESKYIDSLVGLCLLWAIIRMSTYVDPENDNFSPVIEALGRDRIVYITKVAKYLIEGDNFDSARAEFCLKSRSLFYVEEDKETLSWVFSNDREGRLRHLGSFDRKPKIKWP